MNIFLRQLISQTTQIRRKTSFCTAVNVVFRSTSLTCNRRNANNCTFAFLLKSIFKNIPNQIFKAKGEFYYHSLIYLVFFYLGEYIESEINTNDGRLDAVVKTTKYFY